MNFIEWLIKDSDNWDSNSKNIALNILKFEPDHFKAIIKENLIDWSTLFVIHSKRPFMIKPGESEKLIEDIFKAYQEHFKTELEGISTT